MKTARAAAELEGLEDDIASTLHALIMSIDCLAQGVEDLTTEVDRLRRSFPEKWEIVH